MWRCNPKYQIASFLFQDLHSQRDNGVSNIIIKAIRLHLSNDVHKNKNDSFSSKYLYIVSITKMAAHRGVDFFESHDHSGHSLGTNQERKIGPKYPCTDLAKCVCLEWVGG